MSIRLCLLSTVCCGLALGSSPLDILIIAHLVLFVKGFFEDFCLPLPAWFLLPSPLDTFIIAHSVGLVKGFLIHFFSSLSQPLLSTEAVREFFPLPLTLLIIAGF